MTKEQFARGWALLTVQPWGRAYRGLNPEVTIQSELYYKHVHKANPQVWLTVCESSASGDKWPSLSDLKTALTQLHGWEQDGQRQLTHTPEFIECPAEVREKLARLGVNV